MTAAPFVKYKENILKLLVFLWVLADLILSWMGTDLWASVGIRLPDLIWQFSHYAAMGIGAVIFSMGGSGDDNEDQA